MEQLSRQEINAIVDAKIRAHELRIGLISGIAGLVFLAGISYCFLLFILCPMSAPFIPLPLLSQEEWQELNALRKAISNSPSAVVPDKQERFAALFARSLIGKGNQPLN